MKETEIVRGLHKARAKCLARGTPFVHAPKGVSKTGDNVPTMLEDGEAVLPKQTVSAIGSRNLARIIADTNSGRSPELGLRAGAAYAVGMTPRNPLEGIDPELGLGADPAPAVEAPAPRAATAPSRFPVTPENQATLQQGRDAIGPQRAAEAEFAKTEAARIAPQGAPPVEQPAGLGQRVKDVGSAIKGAEGETLAQRASNTLSAAKNVLTGGPAVEGAAAAKPAGVLARGLGAATRLAVPLSLAYAGVKSVNDSPSDIKNNLGMSDDQYDSTGGRILANLANFGDNMTGGAASYVGRGLARLQNGQNFFERSAKAAPAAAEAAAPAVQDGIRTVPGPTGKPVQSYTGAAANTERAKDIAASTQGFGREEGLRRQAQSDVNQARIQREADDFVGEQKQGLREGQMLQRSGWAVPPGQNDVSGLSGLVATGIHTGQMRLAQTGGDRAFKQGFAMTKHNDEMGLRQQELGLKQAQWGMQRGDENAKGVLEGVKGKAIIGGTKEDSAALTANNVNERQAMARNMMGDIDPKLFSRLPPSVHQEYIQHLNNIIDATQGVNKHQAQTMRGKGTLNPRDYFNGDTMPKTDNGLGSWVGRGSAKLTDHLPTMDEQGDIMRLANGAYVPKSAYMTDDYGNARTDIGASMKRLDQIHAQLRGQ